MFTFVTDENIFGLFCSLMMMIEISNKQEEPQRVVIVALVEAVQL